MSVLAIKNQITTNILTPIVLPAQVTLWTKIVSPRQMPKQQKLGRNIAAIVGPEMKLVSMRKSMPRGPAGGNRERVYEVPIYLTAEHKDAAVGADQMDVVVETVLLALEQAQTNVTITDPLTGATSNLHEIGEKYSIQELPTHGVEDNIAGELIFGRIIRCTVSEWSQA